MQNMHEMFKTDIPLIETKGMYWEVDSGGNKVRYTPWIANSVAFLYDTIMRHSVLPRLLDADPARHERIMRSYLHEYKGCTIIELGTGSGASASFLDPENTYYGVDISSGLLRISARKFRKRGFTRMALYAGNAEKLPFSDSVFDIGLCVLTINFFTSLRDILDELHRVMGPKAECYAAVPVPERNRRQSHINGILRSSEELNSMFTKSGFSFTPLPERNGALLYFLARKQ